MTPKEKAKNLFEIYLLETGNETFAKNCALVAVNEVLDPWFGIYTYLPNGQGEFNPNYKYWLEVKQELEKL